jgi:hypothetical protein
MIKNIKEFIVDAGGWGLTSGIAALVSFGIAIWEHFHDKPVSSFIFICLTVPLFCIGSYKAWAKKISTAQQGSDDPLIYLVEIKESGDNFNRETVFVLENKGKSVAHAVQIQPITFGDEKSTFAPLDYLDSNAKSECLPTRPIDDMEKHCLAEVFAEATNNARNADGEYDGNLKFQVVVAYMNHTRDYKFTSCINVIYSHIDAQMSKLKDTWPNSHHQPQPFTFSHEPIKKAKVMRPS